MPVSFSCPFFDLEQIAQSGQCFQWKPVPGGYAIVSGGHFTYCSQNGQDFHLSCSPEDFTAYWRRYFDLDTDYGAMIRQVPPPLTKPFPAL